MPYVIIHLHTFYFPHWTSWTMSWQRCLSTAHQHSPQTRGSSRKNGREHGIQTYAPNHTPWYPLWHHEMTLILAGPKQIDTTVIQWFNVILLKLVARIRKLAPFVSMCTSIYSVWLDKPLHPHLQNQHPLYDPLSYRGISGPPWALCCGLFEGLRHFKSRWWGCLISTLTWFSGAPSAMGSNKTFCCLERVLGHAWNPDLGFRALREHNPHHPNCSRSPCRLCNVVIAVWNDKFLVEFSNWKYRDMSKSFLGKFPLYKKLTKSPSQSQKTHKPVTRLPNLSVGARGDFTSKR